MLGLKPVKLMPARERVASALRKAIISRQIKEGSGAWGVDHSRAGGVSDSREGWAFRAETE